MARISGNQERPKARSRGHLGLRTKAPQGARSIDVTDFI